MKILAIDTATEACSVALLLDKEICEDFVMAPQQHSKIILPMIEKILAHAQIKLTDLDVLAFGKGPGSFTGLRIAASVIQGLAYATDLPVAAISTLQAMAQGAFRQYHATAVLAAIDARMHEIYFGQYRIDKDNLMQACAAEAVCSPTQIALDPSDDWIGVGSGWIAYADVLPAKIATVYDYYPHAYDIAYLAQSLHQQKLCVSAAAALPIYIRDNVATAKPKG